MMIIATTRLGADLGYRVSSIVVSFLRVRLRASALIAFSVNARRLPVNAARATPGRAAASVK
jgi:hypothetical protein